jgi:undecaprenyl-diphosphatase
MAYFWKDFYVILRGVIRGIRHRRPFETQPARLGWYILLSTIPAGFAGLLLRDVIEQAFSNSIWTAVALYCTALLLVIAERIGNRQRRLENLTWLDALVIGTFQILALFPGLSRSGSTIAGGMSRDLDRPAAARFSFLMAVPIMLVAGLTALIDLIQVPDLGVLLPIFVPGFIAAAVVGYLAIGWLLSFLTRYSLYYFAIYCVAVGSIVLLFSLT